MRRTNEYACYPWTQFAMSDLERAALRLHRATSLLAKQTKAYVSVIHQTSWFAVPSRTTLSVSHDYVVA